MLFSEAEAAEQPKNFLSIFCAAPPFTPRRKAEKERKEIFGFAVRAKRALRGALVPFKKGSDFVKQTHQDQTFRFLPALACPSEAERQRRAFRRRYNFSYFALQNAPPDNEARARNKVTPFIHMYHYNATFPNNAARDI